MGRYSICTTAFFFPSIQQNFCHDDGASDGNDNTVVVKKQGKNALQLRRGVAPRLNRTTQLSRQCAWYALAKRQSLYVLPGDGIESNRMV